MAADRATTSNIRLLDPTIISPAFTQFQQGKNFYFFPEQLAIDRYQGADGACATSWWPPASSTRPG